MFRDLRPKIVMRAAYAFCWAAALSAGTGWAHGTLAQDSQDGPDPERIEEIEKRAAQERAAAEALEERARTLYEEMRALRADSVATAHKAQLLETDLSEVEATIETLEAEETRKRSDLVERREQLADTLAALQRIALLPPEAMAGSPESPLKVVRGASMLRIAVPAIEARAADLRADLESLDTLRDDIEYRQVEMRETARALAAEREQLDSLAADKQRLRERAVAESRERAERAEALAAEAEDMRDLVARLEAEAEARAARAAARAAAEATAQAAQEAAERLRTEEPESPEPPESLESAEPLHPGQEGQIARLTQPDEIRSFPDEHGSLRLPVTGTLVTRYGEPLERAGVVEDSRGIVMRARGEAQVVATFDGEVAYAGPFRGYGQILIIEHGGRYHTLLAGLDRIDAVVGQWVLAGEPVGVMADSGSDDPELYIELRRTGRPINPLPWLAETGDKVQG